MMKPSNYTKKEIEINILIKPEEDSEITLNLLLNNDQKFIKLYHPYYGVADRDTTLCYSLNYTYNSSDNLILLTNLYSGLADIYVTKGINTTDFTRAINYNVDENMNMRISNNFLKPSEGQTILDQLINVMRTNNLEVQSIIT